MIIGGKMDKRRIKWRGRVRKYSEKAKTRSFSILATLVGEGLRILFCFFLVDVEVPPSGQEFL